MKDKSADVSEDFNLASQGMGGNPSMYQGISSGQGETEFLTNDRAI